MEDPGLFTLPCRLGDSKPFDTLADLGSCVNIILLYLFKKLNIGLLEKTDHIFGLADRTKSYLVGIVKDVEVHMGKLKLLNDFYMIDMKKDPETPLLVGRGFLATANAVIDCRMAKIAVGEGITRSYSTLLNKSFQLLNSSLNFKALGDATTMLCFKGSQTCDSRIPIPDPSMRFGGVYYALWDVIENGNSFKPAAKTTTKVDDWHYPKDILMTFNKYKDAKTLFAAIQTRFGGNEATKKTQKTLLKLQKIVSLLAILGENISQEDLNLKFLRSLPSEWNTHVVVWRNKPDLDTMSFDDLYNNFKIVEQEVKGTVSSSSSSSSQNMAFVSSPSSTNEVNTVYGVSTANTQVSPASTQVSTASTQVSTANLSDDTVYAFLASQSNGSQLVYEDLEQIHEDDIEEMDLKMAVTL
ncbi:ribonuclease H-like domain-containing protein [Tanacetum coccineum]